MGKWMVAMNLGDLKPIKITHKSKFKKKLILKKIYWSGNQNKKIHSDNFFFVEFWMIKWYGVTVDEIVLTKKNWVEKIILEQKKFNTPKLEKKKFLW